MNDKNPIEDAPVNSADVEIRNNHADTDRDMESSEPERPSPDMLSEESILDYIVVELCEEVDRELFALKGGYVMSRLTPYARHTRDVDLSALSEEARSHILTVLEKIGRGLEKRGVRKLSVQSNNMTFALPNGITLGVDVSVQGLEYGIEVHDGRYRRFTIERMLGDKISASLTPKRFRRVKDLYDIDVILRHFQIDMTELRKMLKRREVVLTSENTFFSPEVLLQWEHAWNRLILQRGAKDTVLEKPPFRDVIERFAAFLEDLMIRGE